MWQSQNHSGGGHPMVGVSGDRQEMTIPAMQKLAKDYTTNARQCAEIATFLKSPLATMFWQSRAASSFEANINQYVKALNDFEQAFSQLSSDVTQRAATLEASHNV
jgi:uncharacterized protein YukE